MKLFVPMALMMLCMLFNFGTLRSIKDSLVVPSIGAEVISFLKLWLVLPSSIIFMFIYVSLSNRFTYARVFYIIVSFFLSFFLLFAYFLHPNQEYYHPNPQYIDSLALMYPTFKWFILISGRWSYALMYIFSDLWSVVVINLLFWQYANHIFDTQSAKRFYPILGMIGNIGLIIAGNFLVSFSDMSGVSDLILSDYGTNIGYQSEHVLKPLIQVIICAGLMAMMLYFYLDNFVLKNAKIKHGFARSTEETQTQLSLKESIKLVISSKYIGHIVVLILCYGLLINILEGPWKARVRQLYPNTVDYMHFMGQFNIWMGVSCVSFMVIGSNILRHFSWLFSALLTPLMIAVTGVLFFICVIFADYISTWGGGVNPIYFAVIVGAAQNILSKSTKYSLFDATKEMTYIPLSLELRTKGKAAVEVIGLKFGKSLGAFLQSMMFMFVPLASFNSITTYLLVVFVFIIIAWIWNIVILSREYAKMTGG